jgi:hypothetical protein
MAKTLTTIEKRQEKISEKYGRPATFGAYLARVAQAIGAAFIVTPTGANRGWSYSESDQRFWSIADGISHVDHLIRQWQTERERAQEERQTA